MASDSILNSLHLAGFALKMTQHQTQTCPSPTGIQQLQLILLKVALIVAVEFHINVEFVRLLEPPEDQEQKGIQSHLHVVQTRGQWCLYTNSMGLRHFRGTRRFKHLEYVLMVIISKIRLNKFYVFNHFRPIPGAYLFNFLVRCSYSL